MIQSILKYFVQEGSVAIDEISSPFQGVSTSVFELSIIPHTWNFTNLSAKGVGDGKY